MKEFRAIAIVGGPKGSKKGELCAPCGVCRQVMMEFCDPKEFQIVLEDGNGGCFAKTLEEILPFGFGPANLREEEVKTRIDGKKQTSQAGSALSSGWILKSGMY